MSDFRLSIGGVTLETVGLDDDSPLLTLRQRCELCGVTISERQIDVSTISDIASLGEAIGGEDADLATEHLDQHRGRG